MTYLKQYDVDPSLAFEEMFSKNDEPVSVVGESELSSCEQEIFRVLSSLSFESSFDFHVFQSQLQPLLLSYIEKTNDVGQSALFLGELLIRYGAGEAQSSLFQLMPFDQIVERVLDYISVYVEEHSDAKTTESSHMALKKIHGSFHYFNCFKSYATLWLGLQKKQKDLEEVESEVKALELKIRDMNKNIKELQMVPFTKDGKSQEYSQFGEVEEIRKKLKDAKIKIGFEDENSEKYNKYKHLISMLETDLSIFDQNERLQADKDLMKENVKKWGLEVKSKREKWQDLKTEVNTEELLLHRSEKINKAKTEGLLEQAFCTKLKALTTSNEDTAGFSDEKISVAAAIRLAEAMKSQMVMPSMMGPAPIVNVTNMNGSGGANQTKEDMSFANMPLKPDFDYTNRDKDTLIQLIYDCDARGISFEKSAETLEALVYKSPSKAAQIMIDQNVRHSVFYLHHS